MWGGTAGGVTSKEMAPWPTMLNVVEGGVGEPREMGFRVVVFSFATGFPAYLAVREAVEGGGGGKGVGGDGSEEVF